MLRRSVGSTRAMRLAPLLWLPTLRALEAAVAVERWAHEMLRLLRLARRPAGATARKWCTRSSGSPLPGRWSRPTAGTRYRRDRDRALTPAIKEPKGVEPKACHRFQPSI